MGGVFSPGGGPAALAGQRGLTISNIESIITSQYSIFEISARQTQWPGMGVRDMPRAKFQTLTEQMFYVLLCLREECCGMDILDRVPDMTGGRVSVGSGTLYDLLGQFCQAGMIRETRVEGRRRSYLLTDLGRETLEKEYGRICAQAEDYRAAFGKGEHR